MMATNSSGVATDSSYIAFTLLELKSTRASLTPFCLFNVPSIRLIQDGQLNGSNWNSIFLMFIFSFCFVLPLVQDDFRFRSLTWIKISCLLKVLMKDLFLIL